MRLATTLIALALLACGARTVAGNECPSGEFMDVTDSPGWVVVPVIDDGDICGNAEHLATAQAHADRSAWLRQGIPGKATSYTTDVPLVATTNVDSRWYYGAGIFRWIQGDITDQGLLAFHLPLPMFGKLSEVHAIIDGGTGGSHVALPANKPALEVYKQSFTMGVDNPTAARIGSAATDAPATVAAYEVPHLLSVTGLDESISSFATYHALIKGESGANSNAGALRLLKIYCVITSP